MTEVKEAWTLVQHSAAVVARDARFAAAVEEARVVGADKIRRVREAGGVIFGSYDEAYDACYRENYPSDVDGLVPAVRGKFSRKRIDGAYIYIMPKEGGEA